MNTEVAKKEEETEKVKAEDEKKKINVGGFSNFQFSVINNRLLKILSAGIQI